MEIPLMYSSSLFGDYRRAIGIPVIHCNSRNSKQGMETKCNVPALGLWLSRSAVPWGIIPKHPLPHFHLNRIPGKMALGEVCRCFAFQNYKRLGRASQTQENPMFFLENLVTWWDTHSTCLPPQSDLKKKKKRHKEATSWRLPVPRSFLRRARASWWPPWPKPTASRHLWPSPAVP